MLIIASAQPYKRSTNFVQNLTKIKINSENFGLFLKYQLHVLAFLFYFSRPRPVVGYFLLFKYLKKVPVAFLALTCFNFEQIVVPRTAFICQVNTFPPTTVQILSILKMAIIARPNVLKVCHGIKSVVFPKTAQSFRRLLMTASYVCL